MSELKQHSQKWNINIINGISLTSKDNLTEIVVTLADQASVQL